MSHRKHGLKALGLSFLAVLGLMAFTAVGAQANWLYLEGGVAKTLTANELVEAKTHEEGTLLLSNGVKIKCKVIKGEDLLLEPGNATTAEASGKVAFSECHTFDKTGAAAPKCDPLNQPIKAGGKAHIILHEGRNYVLFNPPAGLTGAFTTIEFDEEFCSLVATSEVTGSLVAECGQLNGSGVFVGDDCATHAVSHLLRQAPAELFPSDKLKFGELEASLDGIAKVELIGNHAGASWSGEV